MNSDGSLAPEHGRQTVPSVSRPFRGKGRLVDTLGRVLLRARGPERRFSPWPGARFSVDLRDRIQRQMWGGCYEPHIRACLRALLRPGDTVLDVGAHIGYLSAFSARLVGPRGRVFAFEPDPALFRRLQQNLSPYAWACSINSAVWGSDSTLEFERSSFTGESGWGTLTAVRDLGRGEHLKTEAVKLDSWRRESRLDSMDLIKMDVEGSELQALQGAREMLDQFRPTLLLEINGVLLRQGASSSDQVIRYLEERGYVPFCVGWMTVSKCTPEDCSEFAETLCIPEERREPTLASLRRAGWVVSGAGEADE